jgi:hypothetical protein
LVSYRIATPPQTTPLNYSPEANLLIDVGCLDQEHGSTGHQTDERADLGTASSASELGWWRRGGSVAGRNGASGVGDRRSGHGISNDAASDGSNGSLGSRRGLLAARESDGDSLSSAVARLGDDGDLSSARRSSVGVGTGNGRNVDNTLDTTTGSSRRRGDDTRVDWGTLSLSGLDDLDGFEATGLVGPLVLSSGRVVGNLDRVDAHAERCLGVIGLSASPLNRALIVRGVTTSPDTDADSGGGLREVLSAVGIAVVEGADGRIVNQPGEGLGSPVKRIGVELGHSVADCRRNHAVVGRGVALAEVVHLDLVGDTTNELPVNLIKILGLEDNGRDDTLASGSLGLDLDVSEVEIALGLDSRGIALLGENKVGAGRAVRERAGSLLPALDALSSGLEVGVEGGGHGGVVGALLLRGVAFCECLGAGDGDNRARADVRCETHCRYVLCCGNSWVE